MKYSDLILEKNGMLHGSVLLVGWKNTCTLKQASAASSASFTSWTVLEDCKVSVKRNLLTFKPPPWDLVSV